MFKAIKDNKIIAINEIGEFPCLVHDSVEEDTEHQLSDYVHCDGQFVLTVSDEAIEQKKAEVRAVRNQYLKQYVDDRAKSPFMWNEIPEEEKALIGEYRKYLMDYPETEGWYKHSPMSFEEWIASYESSPVQRLDKQRNCKSTGKSV